MPGGDLFTGGTIEATEVVLHFAKVRKQFPCRGGELLISVADTGILQQRDCPGLNLGDLDVEFIATAPEVGQPPLGVGVGAMNDLSQ